MKKYFLPDYRDVRKEAGSLLTPGNTRMCMIFAVILFVLPIAVFFALEALFIVLQELGLIPLWIAAILFFSLCFLFILLFLYPMLMGWFRMGKNLAQRKENRLFDLFYYFEDSEKYKDCLRFSFPLCGRILLFASVLVATCLLLPVWTGGGVLPALLIAGLAVLECAAGVVLLSVRFFEIYFWMEQKTNLTEKSLRFSAGIRFFLGELPWVLLGLFTVGILWVADVLPRMPVTYFQYCQEIMDDTTIVRNENE